MFARRERPALLFDREMNPTHLFNGIKPADGIYHGKVYSYVQRIRVHLNLGHLVDTKARD